VPDHNPRFNADSLRASLTLSGRADVRRGGPWLPPLADRACATAHGIVRCEMVGPKRLQGPPLDADARANRCLSSTSNHHRCI